MAAPRVVAVLRRTESTVLATFMRWCARWTDAGKALKNIVTNTPRRSSATACAKLALMKGTPNPSPSGNFAPSTHVPLAPLTTLRLGGAAAFFCEAAREQDVITAVAWAKAKGVPLFVLGGGSNVVIADAGFDGLVMHMALRGLVPTITMEGPDVHLTVAAGEPWDQFVARATALGWAGVECLACIPGQVGSTPIQNVGAYGQDVSETVNHIRVLDRTSLSVQRLEAADLRFEYRNSVLRNHPDRFVVLDVTFKLRAGGAPCVRYAELQKALAAVAKPTLADVHAKVLELRRRKSMVLDPDDPNTRSAGSFFTNPIVDAKVAAHVLQSLVQPAAEMPQWPQSNGRIKLSAAWLIEKAGFFRGHRHGPVGISSAHALALVHDGSGRTADLLDLARNIRQGVLQQFGVNLQPEPMLIGDAWDQGPPA